MSGWNAATLAMTSASSAVALRRSVLFILEEERRMRLNLHCFFAVFGRNGLARLQAVCSLAGARVAAARSAMIFALRRSDWMCPPASKPARPVTAGGLRSATGTSSAPRVAGIFYAYRRWALEWLSCRCVAAVLNHLESSRQAYPISAGDPCSANRRVGTVGTSSVSADPQAQFPGSR